MVCAVFLPNQSCVCDDTVIFTILTHFQIIWSPYKKYTHFLSLNKETTQLLIVPHIKPLIFCVLDFGYYILKPRGVFCMYD